MSLAPTPAGGSGSRHSILVVLNSALSQFCKMVSRRDSLIRPVRAANPPSIQILEGRQFLSVSVAVMPQEAAPSIVVVTCDGDEYGDYADLGVSDEYGEYGAGYLTINGETARGEEGPIFLSDMDCVIVEGSAGNDVISVADFPTNYGSVVNANYGDDVIFCLGSGNVTLDGGNVEDTVVLPYREGLASRNMTLSSVSSSNIEAEKTGPKYVASQTAINVTHGGAAVQVTITAKDTDNNSIPVLNGKEVSYTSTRALYTEFPAKFIVSKSFTDVGGVRSYVLSISATNNVTTGTYYVKVEREGWGEVEITVTVN